MGRKISLDVGAPEPDIINGSLSYRVNLRPSGKKGGRCLAFDLVSRVHNSRRFSYANSFFSQCQDLTLAVQCASLYALYMTASNCLAARLYHPIEGNHPVTLLGQLNASNSWDLLGV